MPGNRIRRLPLSKKLRQEKKSNEYFELMLGNLRLEEIIGLKLEIGLRSNEPYLYGFDILRAIRNMATEAVLVYGMSICKNQTQLAEFLGKDLTSVYEMKKKYRCLENILKESDNDNTGPVKKDF